MKKRFTLLLVLLSIACFPVRFSSRAVHAIEVEDDNLCMAEGIEYDSSETRGIYWVCRLRILDQRIAGNFRKSNYGIFYRRDFERLKDLIINKLVELREEMLSGKDASNEEKEREFCLLSVRKLKDYEAVAKKYLECIENSQNNGDTSKYENVSNEIFLQNFWEEDTTTEIIVKSSEDTSGAISGNCVKYATDADKLKKCQKLLSQVDNCTNNLDELTKQRQIDDRLYCHQHSIDQYPESLAKFSTGKTNASALGPRIQKYDLVKLREIELKRCTREREVKFPSYIRFLEEECKAKYLDNL
jgi:hypothetical protein